MLSSSPQKFQSIDFNPHHLGKPKRRRRRKKLHKNNNNVINPLSFLASSTTKVLEHNSLTKTKQYFQHDNRLVQNGTKIKQTIYTSSRHSTTINNYNAEVAKKFKPVNVKTTEKNFKKSTKSLKYNSQRYQEIKKENLKKWKPNSRLNPQSTQASLELQTCVCPCQKTQKSNSNRFQMQTEILSNIYDKLSMDISAANVTNSTSSLLNCINHFPTSDSKKILEELKRKTPILTLEALINNVQLLKYVEELKRVRDSHQLAEAQQEKNSKLREAFNISEHFVEGSSFDSDRKAKEELSKSLALQKELDAQRDQTAAAAAKDKEYSKRYALVRTPSMEHDVSGGSNRGDTGNDVNTIKKKKKKKTRESSISPERKKDKKKKSKKRKKESKSKKSKKLRKRKSSGSESNVDNDKESDEGSESEIEVDSKKNRKKVKKKDKKKRRNKKREICSSSDNSPVNRYVEIKTGEAVRRFKSFERVFRSHSNEKHHKSKDLKHNASRCYDDRNERTKSNLRSNSRSGKNISSRRSKSRIDNNDRRRESLRESYLKHGSRSSDYRSRERNDGASKYRRSRSHQRSNRDIASEHTRNIKRRHSGEYSQGKRNTPSVDKRKRFSRSKSSSPSKQTKDKKFILKTTEIESNSSRTRSRTPREISLDSNKKVKNSRSRSTSVKEILQKKSLTPPFRMCESVESEKYNTNTLKNQENLDSKVESFKLKDKNAIGLESRSRTMSTSSSNTGSSSDSETFKSRSCSPQNEDRRKPLISDSKKSLEMMPGSQSPSRTPTSATQYASRSKSRPSSNDTSRKDKIRSSSTSHDFLEKPKENDEEQKKLLSRTPPHFKGEKKVLTPRSSRDSSDLSYSPARRNPERYREIIESTKNHKSVKIKFGDKDLDRKGMVKSYKHHEEHEWDRKEKGLGKTDRNQANQAKPIVRLQSQSDEDSDSNGRNAEKILDEFQESKHEKELKDLKLLEQLKTGIAAKAKEKIKTIEKMAASISTGSASNNDGEVSDKPFKRTVRNSLNDFLAANNVTPAVAINKSPNEYSIISNSTPGAIYPQTLEERKKEQESTLKITEISSHIDNNKNINRDNDAQFNCKKSLMTANGHVLPLGPTASPLRTNLNPINRDKDRKRERDFRERDREISNFNKDRYLERRQRSSPIIYSIGGGGIGGGGIAGGRRINNNNSIHNINHRQQRLNLICNSGVGGAHHHNSHLHLRPHHHHPNHKIINNHHNTTSSSTVYIANNSTNPHGLMCNHANNSTNISFNRPSRINNTPLITATQFNNQMLNKQSNSILVNRRDHRTALNLGLSGTPCTNFSNSNLLLTKANTNPNHLHAVAVGHVVGGGHQHHHHHHHHHHNQNANMSGGSINPTTQITDRILMAASIAAAQRKSLGVVHSAASSVAAVAAANNLNFLQQQNKPKLVIKPFKINDSQPLVAALADSSLVDAIVSKVSTATVAAAESAARRSRSRSRRSRSRNRHEKTSSGCSNNGGGGAEREGNRRRSVSRSRSSSSTSSRSRSRSHSRRSSRSHSSHSSSSSHTSSRSSSSTSFGSSRSGTRSPSIPRRRGSPSFLDRRRITSARKRPIPYHRKLPSDLSSCYCSSCCSRDSSPRSRSQSRDSRSPSGFF